MIFPSKWRLVRKTVTFLAFLFPAAFAAQSIITISPQQCVWRSGDDLRWAVPNLDETGWQPYSQWKLQPDQPHIWARCHADLSTLRSVAQPAVQIRLYAAYELYLNGQLLGSAGNLRSGNFSMNAIRSYPIAGSDLSSGPSTLALRITQNDPVSNSSPLLGLIASGMELRAGDRSMLDALRSNVVLARSSRYIATALCFGIIGVIAVMILGLYLADHSRTELLLLGLTCLSVALLRLNEFGAASLLNFSINASLALVVVGNITHVLTEVPFFYALARRRMPPLVWILLIAAILSFVPSGISIFLYAGQSAWLEPFNRLLVRPVTLTINMTLSLVPFFAFWPYSQIERRVRPLAVLCMLWGIADFVWFAVEMTGIQLPAMPNLFAIWGQTLLEIRAFTTAGVLAALLGLLFREQRQVTEERAMLTGEMRAARAVQQVIIPEAVPSVPGFVIESIYKPAGEVGGDFFQILPTAAGGVLIVIGDVSGKGMPAAMTVSLLVGTVRTLAHYTQRPAEILAAMNTRMLGRSQGGFTTCIVLRADPDGSLTVANAGHLAPYLHGKELTIENGLPLGLDSRAIYPESKFDLPPGGRLTFLSDGVVEARNSAGELFGFDRTAALSMDSAENIAHAAQHFGQEDDITVLTLTLAPAAVAHA